MEQPPLPPPDDKPSPSMPWCDIPPAIQRECAIPERSSGASSAEETAPEPGLKHNEPLDDADTGTPFSPTARAAEWGWPDPIPIPDRLIALALGLLGMLAVGMTPGGYGISWDEAYYYQPSVDAAGWLRGALRLESGWAGREAVELGFGRIWELPPVVKFANGIAWATASSRLGELRALRLSPALAYGLCIVFVFALGRMAWGRAGALAAAIAYGGMPRVFGHAHFAASETWTALMMLVAVYAFLRGLRRPAWSIFAALAFAAALATKVNAVFLPLLLLPWAWMYHRRASLNNLYAWVFLTPLFFVLMWPWLWHDTAMRLLQYIEFAIGHPRQGLWFLNRRWNFGGPPAPWYYPLAITAVSTPPVTLLLMLGGAVVTLASWRRSTTIARLIFWSVLVLFAMACLPSTPKYDGLRLFFPVLPFLALMVGAMTHSLAHLGHDKRLHRSVPLTGKQAIATAIVVFLAGGSVFSIARNHPRELSYFNSWAGGLSGAEQRGFEVTYWCDSLDEEVVKELNRLLPPNARLKTFAFHALSLQILQQWGRLRPDIQVDPPQPHTAFLLQYRKGFWGRTEHALFQQADPVAVWGRDGVPFLLLYIEGTPKPRP